MSRAALAATVALALAAVVLAPELVSTAPGSRAAAADCAWQRESKRVVRHVKRHGRVRRQVRVVPRWVCVPQAQPAQPPAAAPSSPSAPPTEPAPQPQPPEIERLSVTARDSGEPWSLTLSHPSVKAGEVIVELNNTYGGDSHNLNLELEGGAEAPLAIPEAGPAEHRSGRLTLAPGSYRLWCSLPEHEEKGMHTTLVVEGD